MLFCNVDSTNLFICTLSCPLFGVLDFSLSTLWVLDFCCVHFQGYILLIFLILWTIALYFGRFVVIVQSGCISGLNSASHLKYLSSGNKKYRQGIIPNRPYHHIQRANRDFSPGIVAFTRYFQVFLSGNIKRITQTLYQYLRDWMAGAEGLEPSTKVLETHVLPLHHAPSLFSERVLLYTLSQQMSIPFLKKRIVFSFFQKFSSAFSS